MKGDDSTSAVKYGTPVTLTVQSPLKEALIYSPVQPGDIGNRNAFRTFRFAGIGVGAGAKTFFVHLFHHVQHTGLAFCLTLGNNARCDTFAETKSMAEEFLQAATQAPQPIQAAASMAISA